MMLWPGASPMPSMRAASRHEHCVTSMIIEGGAIKGVRTTRGDIMAPKVGLAVAGNTSVLCAMAGLTVPVESHLMQAFVSEGLKPLIDQVITFGAAHFYISQSDKGGFGSSRRWPGWLQLLWAARHTAGGRAYPPPAPLSCRP